jgi:virginiamycin B lyase
VRLRPTHLMRRGRFSTGLVSLGLAASWAALPGCGEDGGGGDDRAEFAGQAPGTGGGGSELPPPGAAGSSTASETPSAGGTGAGSEMPSSEVVTPIGGVSNGGAPALGEPEPSAAGGTVGTIPIIDGPPPPAVTFDEFEIPEPSQPGWITAGPDGQIWFTHQSTAPSAISKVTTQGTPFVRYNTSITNTGPRGITFGADGNVWYTKQGGIGRMQPGGMSMEFGVPNGGDSAGITLGLDGNLWFTQQIGNRISRFNPNGQFQSFDLPTPSSAPVAIATADDGNLWFTETAVGANKIGRISPNGEITEFAIPTAASNPTGITQGPGAELWFTEQDVAKIGKITPDGVITEFYIPSGNRPSRIVTGPDGNLWFTLRAANAIGRITPLGQVSEYAIPTRASDPYDITVGPDQNLWFTELSSNKIGRLSNFAGGGNVMAVEGGARGEELGGDTACAKDTDCIESGRACGGDVCGTEKTCVLAVSSDPGTCVSDADCWCQSRGATCAEGHCSFVTPGDAP